MIVAFLTSSNCRIGFVASVALLTALASCEKSKTTTARSKDTKIDACSLITKEEAQSIQGAPVKDTKSSEQSNGGFRNAQCFYTTDPFNKSVSLAVTQGDPASPTARNVKDFWKETFGRFEGKEKEEEGDEEKKKSLGREAEEEKGLPPKKIDGIGDAAYWNANRMGGALYVLKNDVFIRVSVGGPEKEETMINRCKALAEKALSRL